MGLVTPRGLERRGEFFHQLGVMLGAGVGLVGCLGSLGRGGLGRWFGREIGCLVRGLEGGLSFAEAAGGVRGWLSGFDLALLEAGERSGRLDVCLGLLGEFCCQRASVLRRVFGGLVLPLLVLHGGVLVSGLPGLFGGVGLGGYLWGVGLVLVPLYVVGGLLLVLCLGGWGWGVRGWLEWCVGWVPFLGSGLGSLGLARLCLGLGSLLGAGVGVGRAWVLAARASGSARIVGAVGGFEAGIEGGRSPGELLSEGGFFPELFVSLYVVGEESGRLDEGLVRLRRFYEEDGFGKVGLFGVWFPRVVYFVVSVYMVFLIFGLYGGVFGGGGLGGGGF